MKEEKINKHYKKGGRGGGGGYAGGGGGGGGGGWLRCTLQSPFQISKIKGSNKTKQKIGDNLLKRKKREIVAFLSSFYVYTRLYVYQQTFFFQNFPPQSPL